MRFRVYNENGTIKVTKIDENGVEEVMVSNILPGQAAEIEVFATTSYHACLNALLIKE